MGGVSKILHTVHIVFLRCVIKGGLWNPTRQYPLIPTDHHEPVPTGGEYVALGVA